MSTNEGVAGKGGLAFTTHLLFWVVTLVHWPKIAEIGNRPWLLMHWLVSGVLVVALFLATLYPEPPEPSDAKGPDDKSRDRAGEAARRQPVYRGDLWETVRFGTWAFTVLVLANCGRFGSLPLSTALCVNIGFLLAMNIASLCDAWGLYALFLGLPSFFEAAIFAATPILDIHVNGLSAVSSVSEATLRVNPVAVVLLCVFILLPIAHFCFYTQTVDFYREHLLPLRRTHTRGISPPWLFPCFLVLIGLSWYFSASSTPPPATSHSP